MTIFSSILARLLPADHPAISPAELGLATATDAGSTTKAQADSPEPALAPGAAAPPSTRPPAPMATVDLESVIGSLPSAQRLRWRTSIVDFLQVLNLDSSPATRKELAHELLYAGSVEDQAALDEWLLQEVMSRLRAVGARD